MNLFKSFSIVNWVLIAILFLVKIVDVFKQGHWGIVVLIAFASLLNWGAISIYKTKPSFSFFDNVTDIKKGISKYGNSETPAIVLAYVALAIVFVIVFFSDLYFLGIWQ